MPQRAAAGPEPPTLSEFVPFEAFDLIPSIIPADAASRAAPADVAPRAAPPDAGPRAGTHEPPGGVSHEPVEVPVQADDPGADMEMNDGDAMRRCGSG